MTKKLRILPLPYLEENGLKYIPGEETNFNLFSNAFFYSSGKEAIHKIMQFEHIQRHDEVFITTTTNANFVSSCVTSTVFNYGKVSRVLTENTKLIFVIHEFGFPHHEIKELVRIAKDRDIPLVEDIAHSFNTLIEGRKLGSFGDYCIHSLPKSFPVPNGGVLITNKNFEFFNRDNNDLVKDNFERYKDSLTRLKRIRVQQYKQYQKVLEPYSQVYQLLEGTNPFAFGFKTDKYKEIYQKLEGELGIEMLRTYVENWVIIPLNPLFTAKEVSFIIVSIQNIVNK